MDVASIVSSIANLGFPAVLCAILLYLMEKNNDRHKEELDKLNETVKNNTDAINKLTEKILDVELARENRYRKFDKTGEYNA